MERAQADVRRCSQRLSGWVGRAITPAAGYVDGYGALAIGVISSFVVWLSFTKLSQRWIFKKVDDAFGVVHTHGVAGLLGGVLTGVFADPAMVEYLGTKKTASVAVTGLLYGHPGQVLIQIEAAGMVIAISAIGTFVLLKLIGLVVPLRYDDRTLHEGDLAIHDEEIHTTEVEEELDEALDDVLAPARAVPRGAADDGLESSELRAVNTERNLPAPALETNG